MLWKDNHPHEWNIYAFAEYLSLFNNQITRTLPSEIGNMNVGKYIESCTSQQRSGKTTILALKKRAITMSGWLRSWLRIDILHQWPQGFDRMPLGCHSTTKQAHLCSTTMANPFLAWVSISHPTRDQGRRIQLIGCRKGAKYVERKPSWFAHYVRRRSSFVTPKLDDHAFLST